jgi:hypothetical protein
MAGNDEVVEGWRKSSRSNPGQCVEIMIGAQQVHIRHSQDREGPVLSFTHPEWQAFLDGVRGCEFDV